MRPPAALKQHQIYAFSEESRAPGAERFNRHTFALLDV
jgi:hypothetical protein